jgi:hypothetical protein
MIAIFLLINIFVSGLYAQEEWSLKEEDSGIKVYSRHGQSKNNEIKVELTISAKLSDIAAVLLDIPGYSEWSYNCQRSYVLKQMSKNELYFYNEVKTVWPASDRDVVARLRMTQDTVSRILSVRTVSDPHFIPEKKDFVRVPFSDETWTVTPLNSEKVHIVYNLQIDPGGSAPAWLINLFSTKAPLESFKKFSIQVKQSKYQQTVLDFIRN